jgi:hypothetical protein
MKNVTPLGHQDTSLGFDYHRWRVVRNLIEVQEGLTMVDRKFYTGFVNEQGHEIRGRAAQWHMASWLVEKLDDIVITGYKAADSGCQDAGLSVCQSQGETCQVQDAVQERMSLHCETQGDSLLVQDVQDSLTQSTENVPSHDRGGALLEQAEAPEDDNLFDKDWFIGFRQSIPRVLGLIWGGSVHNIRREAA